MTKLIILKIIFIDLEGTTLLFISLRTLYKRPYVSSVRKSKVSKINGMKIYWLLEHTFSCLTTLLEPILRASCTTVKPLVFTHTSGETQVKSIQTCFPLTHPYTITFADLSVDLPIMWVSQKIHKPLFLHRYSNPSKYIKHDIAN